jgi:SAM-dependent methyltransferase
MNATGKRELLARAVELRDAGCLFDPADAEMHELFAGSIDRFCDIALRLRDSRRVLDVGAGHGVLLALLTELGHECAAVDVVDPMERHARVYREHNIAFQRCNVEVEALPFASASFDAVVCCQVLEHFTHSHLPAVREMHRVLRNGGVLEVDVPNVASLRNRSRMLRGRNITYDYVEHYLLAEPVLHAGRSFYPIRHNREFTRSELRTLLELAGFRSIEVEFLRSRRYRSGLARLNGIGSALRDAWPSVRKSLIAFAEK